MMRVGLPGCWRDNEEGRADATFAVRSVPLNCDKGPDCRRMAHRRSRPGKGFPTRGRAPTARTEIGFQRHRVAWVHGCSEPYGYFQSMPCRKPVRSDEQTSANQRPTADGRHCGSAALAAQRSAAMDRDDGHRACRLEPPCGDRRAACRRGFGRRAPRAAHEPERMEHAPWHMPLLRGGNPFQAADRIACRMLQMRSPLLSAGRDAA